VLFSTWFPQVLIFTSKCQISVKGCWIVSCEVIQHKNSASHVTKICDS